MKKIIVIITCLLLLTLLYPNAVTYSKNTTIYVDDDNTEGPWDGTLEHPFQYIQDGIKAASAGDSVSVFYGFYSEDVVVDKNIRLHGEPPSPFNEKHKTVLNGSRDKFVILILPGLESVSISDFVIQNGAVGIFTYENKDIWISNNIIQKCDVSGIIAWKTDYIWIRNNIIQNCNDVGIMIEAGKGAIIHDNYLFNTSVGMGILYSFNAVIHRNLIKNNRWNLYLYSECRNNTITNNQIINASEVGVTISPESYNNILYHNLFIGNKIHAYDEGYNKWYKDNISGGNFWDDYKGTDDDGDGIGDTPYSINGTGNQDNYPFIDAYGWINVELGIEGGTSVKFTVVNNGYESVYCETEFSMHRLVLRTSWTGYTGSSIGPGGERVWEEEVSKVGFWSVEAKISVCNKVLEKKGLVLLGYVILFEKSDKDYWFFDCIKKVC